MRVLVVECGKPPRVEEVKGLREMQQIVGGAIQAIYPWKERVALVCNDESVLLGMSRNVEVSRYGWVHGTFFICGIGEESFVSLPEELVDKFTKLFEGQRVVLAGQLYKHFKGGLYVVLAVAEHTESGEQFVVYRSLEGESKIWARPEEMFLSKVEGGGYRFELCEESY